MTAVVLAPVLFRQLFPEFADAAAYPDAVLQARWDNEATSFVSPEICGDLSATKRGYAVQLALAHVLRLSKVIAQAGAGVGMTGVVTGATIDKVAVTLAPPPARGEWGHWLAQTPYGQQLSALLAAASAGGFYAGGNPERAAFRKVGGVY